MKQSKFIFQKQGQLPLNKRLLLFVVLAANVFCLQGQDLTINTASSSGITTSVDGNTVTYTAATSGSPVLNVNTIITQLNAGFNVTVISTRSITVSSSISVNPSAAVALSFQSTGTGGSSFTSFNSGLSLTSAGSPLSVEVKMRTGSTSNGSYANFGNLTVTTNGGDFTVSGITSYAATTAAVLLDGASITTGAGSISINGDVNYTSASSNTWAVRIVGATSLSTTTGDINIYGQLRNPSTATSADSRAVLIAGTSSVQSTAGGNISITGQVPSGSSADPAYVLQIQTSGTIASSGTVIIKGNNLGSTSTVKGALISTNISTSGHLQITGTDVEIASNLNTSSGNGNITLSSSNELVLGSGANRTINAGSGNVSILAESPVFDGGASYRTFVTTTGTFTIAPYEVATDGFDNVATQIEFQGSINSGDFDGSGDIDGLSLETISALGGLTIGASGGDYSSGDGYHILFDAGASTFGINGPFTIYGNTVTVNSSISSSGAITIDAGEIRLEAGLSSTAAGAAILLQATGDILTSHTTTTARTISTTNGNLSIIADSDANGSGHLNLDYTTFEAGTSDVVIRGETVGWTVSDSATPTVDNTTGGFTFESSDASFGQYIQTGWFNFPSTLSSFTIGKSTNTEYVGITLNDLSVAGPISVYGGSIGVDANITATGGDVLLDADLGTTLSPGGHGILLDNAVTIQTVTSGDITLIGRSGDGSVSGGYKGIAASDASTVSLNAAGNLSLTGYSYTSTSGGGRGVDLFDDELTAGGSITITGQHASGSSYAVSLQGTTELTAGSGITLESLNNTTGTIHIDNSGTIDGGSGDVVLRGANIGIYDTDNQTITTTGAVYILPDADETSFNSAFSTQYLIIVNGASGVWIGADGNTADITIGRTLFISGPLSVYGGDISVSGILNTSGGGTLSSVFFKAAGNITQVSGIDITTGGGDIIYWADSDEDNAGHINFTGSGYNLTTYGGDVIMGGGAGTTVPTGYAHGGTTAPGVDFDITVASGVIDTRNSGSTAGDIIVRGKTTGAFDGIYTQNIQFFGNNLTLDGSTVTAANYGVRLGSSNVYNGTNLSQVIDIDNDLTITAINTAASYAGNALRTGVNPRVYADGNITINSSGVLNYASNQTFLNINPGKTLSVNFDGTASFTTSLGDPNTGTPQGALLIQSYQQNSFTSAFSTATWTFNSNLSGLTIGKTTNTANITLGSAATISGPITVYGGDIAVNAAFTATGDNINLYSSGAVTQTAALTADGLHLGGTGDFTLTNTGNSIGTLTAGDAANDVGDLSVVDASGGLTIGDGAQGLSATGPISVETLTGDIIIRQDITTGDSSSSAVVINAGKSSNASTATGGDIIIMDSPELTMGANGIAKLFSGSGSPGHGLTDFVGSIDNVRLGVDETSTITPSLSAGNAYALYRMNESNITFIGEGLGGGEYDLTDGVLTVSGNENVSISAITNHLESNPDLTIQVTGNVVFDTALTATGNLTIIADADGNQDGDITFNQDIIASTLNLEGNSATLAAGKHMNVGGNLVNNTTLVLESDSNSFSSMKVGGSISGTGTMAYNRYVNSFPNNDLVSAPFTGGMTFGDIITNSAAGTFETNPNNANMHLFGPYSTATDTYVNYTTTSHSDQAIVAGKGYRAGGNDTAGADHATFKVDSDGYATHGVVVGIDLDNSGNGWNLVGNPYPTYLSMLTLLQVNSNVLYQGESWGIYGYNGAFTNDPSEWEVYNLNNASGVTIAPGQGFFVRTDASDQTFSFYPDMQTNTGDDDFISGRSTNSESHHIKLRLGNGQAQAETDIYLNANGSNGLDIGYDSSLFQNAPAEFALYSHLVADNQGLPMAIQTLSTDVLTNPSTTAIPLGVESVAGTQLTFGIDTSNLPVGTQVFLEDAQNNSFTDLTQQDYIVGISDALSGIGRFYIHLGQNSTLSTNDNAYQYLQVYAPKGSGTIVVSGLVESGMALELYDLLGRNVMTQELEASNGRQTFAVGHLADGTYVVRLQGNKGSRAVKVILSK